MSTKARGVYAINSDWTTGSLIYFEKAYGMTTTGNILKVGATAVQVGDTANLVDFGWYATGGLSFVLSASGASLTIAGIDVSLTGDLTIDTEDIKLGDNDSLEFGDATGGDVNILWDASNLVILPATDDTGAIQIGNDGTKSMDMKWFGATASSYMQWDNSDNRLELDGADINLQDVDYLQFGDSQDVTMHWDGALYFTPVASNSMLALGANGRGLDVRFFTNTADYYVDWDASNNNLKFNTSTHIRMMDKARIYFGDSDDVSIHWDGTLYFTTAVANTILALGADGQGMDVRFYTNTAGHYVRWNPATNMLDFIGATGISCDGTTFLSGGGNLIVTGSATLTSATLSGELSVDDTTDSASTTSGSIHTDGGLGVVKKLYVGGDASFQGNITMAVNKDFQAFGTDGDHYILWDSSDNRLEVTAGNSIKFEDSARLYFGTGSDMNLFFDGTQLYFACAIQNIAFSLGSSGSGLSLILESNTADHYVQWIPATNMLNFHGAVGLGVNEVMGATYNGAVTNITVSRGIVTAVS